MKIQMPYDMPEKEKMRIDQEAHEFASDMTNALNRILCPHRYERPNDVFGRNDIEKLIIDQHYDGKAWPKFEWPTLATKTFDPIRDFYEPMVAQMQQEYFAFAFEKSNYKTKEELRRLPRFDVSKSCQDGTNWRDITFPFQDKDKELCEKYGTEIFLPCMSEYVIQTHKKHLLYIKTKKRDTENNTHSIQFSDYLIDVQGSACVLNIEMELSFSGDSIEWASNECTAYEEFLTKYIKDMPWDETKIQLWFDVFGVYHNDNISIVELPIAFADDIAYIDQKMKAMYPHVIHRQSDIDKLKKYLKQISLQQPKTLMTGEAARNYLMQKTIDELLPKLLMGIAFTNLQLVKNNTNNIMMDETNKMLQLPDMIIRYTAPIRTYIRTA